MSTEETAPPMRAWIEELVPAIVDRGDRPQPRGARPPAARGSALAAPAISASRGLVSAVWAGRRLFLLQTEVVDGPPRLVRSLLLANGAALLKRERTAEAHSPEDTSRVVREQHGELEADVRGRLARLAHDKVRAGRNACFRLFERGLEAYCHGDYETALEHWRRVREMASDETALALSIRAAEAHLSPPGRD
jgi:hypothetical protein